MDNSFDFEMSSCKKVFASLNPNQYKALTTSPSNVLQILAGPGTGKTRVITARVAYLLCEKKIPPQNIIVTTFTKKAANEMKDRLAKLIDTVSVPVDLKKLVIGTFHSICVRILRIFGKLIDLNVKFSIADDTDSKQLIKRVLETKFNRGKPSGANDIKVKTTDIQEYKYFISACKSKAQFPNEVPPKVSDHAFEDHLEVYHKYQQSLINNNLIDFDDCLLLTYKLLKEHPKCLRNIEHVLVDEFQDTNLVQLELMYLFALNSNHKVTVVGDPDQSIYGFRHAEANNFYRMEDHYKKLGLNVVKVQLDQNYRSTSNILRFAETLMRTKQTAARPEKDLKSNTQENTPVYFDQYPTNKDEAMHIANDIKNLTKNKYKYSDIAVIIRSSFLSRALEQEMIHFSIPYIIMHGKSFWERKEIKVMVDFLRSVASNSDWLGFSRTLEFCTPGMGAMSLERIENEFEAQRKDGHKGNVYHILKEIVKGKRKRFSSKVKEGIERYMKTIHGARKFLKNESLTNEQKLDHMFDYIVEQQNLVDLVSQKKTSSSQSPDEIKQDVKENLDELRNQLLSFDPPDTEVLNPVSDEEEGTALLTSVETHSVNKGELNPVKLLTAFLDSIYLYEESHYNQSKTVEEEQGRVVVTTIHGSKGLEWPIVFVPGLCDGILPSKYVLQEENPSKRKSAMDEECRCLYVAVTRAKERLHLSCFAENDGFGFGGNEIKPVSQLLKGKPLKMAKRRKHEEQLNKSSRRTGFFQFNKLDRSKYRSRNAKEAMHYDSMFSHIPKAAPIGFKTAKDMLKDSARDNGSQKENPYKKRKKTKKHLGMGRGPMKPFKLN
ncbi:hypothetical protein BRETT_000293 [Brettanomyces bruxellensis]|uniref:DNA 3'-5' helicase n=1 Tax=Dekkera bruxellensis TaxID=5007 RepID=A0A871R2D8_DEKBR|nr:uncharacterized protein BRETT_000293 [Brettanomyces bruxellensis]QOU20583.1 hypothetical protein BRETT_000293 [Brettanomyces bruxellensis]